MSDKQTTRNTRNTEIKSKAKPQNCFSKSICQHINNKLADSEASSRLRTAPIDSLREKEGLFIVLVLFCCSTASFESGLN